ncbi:hypothetical protein ABZ383_25150 [Streptomyces sp. NPDC005900]
MTFGLDQAAWLGAWAEVEEFGIAFVQAVEQADRAPADSLQ